MRHGWQNDVIRAEEAVEPLEVFNQLIADFKIPSSSQCRELADIDSSARKRIRYLQSRASSFKTSSEDFESATWSFISIEKDFQNIQWICTELSTFLKARVQCNAYLTPPNSQGLPLHYDLHDILVKQVEGEKRWNLWNAFRKTVSKDSLSLDERTNLPAIKRLLTPNTKVLHPGDSLALSAGSPHECITMGRESFHLTFGVYHD